MTYSFEDCLYYKLIHIHFLKLFACSGFSILVKCLVRILVDQRAIKIELSNPINGIINANCREIIFLNLHFFCFHIKSFPKNEHFLPFETVFSAKGGDHMTHSDFQLSVEKKFDYMCRLVLINEKKKYYKQIKNLSDREVSFSDVGNYTISQMATIDSYSVDNYIFRILGLSIEIENELLVGATENLSDKKRTIILLYYFVGLNDSEIAMVLSLKRSTVNRQRNQGLSLIKKYLEVKSDEK